jgi:hypothetical protein
METKLSSKRALFLSAANTRNMIRTLFKLGKQPIRYFEEVVPATMKTWKGLCTAEAYESIDGDLLAELQAMNKDFISQQKSIHCHRPEDVKHMPETVEGYRCMDFAPRIATIVSRDMYRRDNNPLLLQQKIHTRNYDSNIRLGHTHSSHVRGYDMSGILTAIDRPYRTASTLDADPLYGFDMESSAAIAPM